ncbi:hypothetical protein LWI28_002096 [Acer negundo]|uniref:Uncharacterized protein n=1 Tax=Acer negundo TaxID=4023 RepID=A0AAD5NZ44_ACENE|nr:hypothetical protein LWI28_002096 [Acer negundo]
MGLNISTNFVLQVGITPISKHPYPHGWNSSLAWLGFNPAKIWGKNISFFFEEKRSHLFHLYIELTSLLEAARQINFSDISNQIAAEIASGRHAEDLNSGFVSASIYIQVKLS